MAAPIQLHTGTKSIQIGFTDQRLSPHAGSATFWGWLLAGTWRATLQAALPHPPPLSNNHLTPLDKALAFVQGLLADARKLTHVAYLRRDPLVPELLGIRRVASQSSLSRFFQGFNSAAVNLRCFRPLWQWGLNRLPSRREGYTLDLDSTRLLHEDGQQEGVAVGYTRQGLKPCLNPLLATLAEVRLVVQLWLRPGNASCGNNAVAFFLDLWEQLPRHIRLRGVRADAGFCRPELLALWERLRLPYVVVAQLSQPIQRLLRGDLVWTATEVPDTEVAEQEYQALGWPQARRFVLIRHRVHEQERRAGKKLLEVPGYHFQALVTSLPASVPPLAVWRYYNGRADCENVIKELQQGFALPSLCLHSFWATEAALSLAALTYNLTVLFQRHLGWQQKVTIQSLRYWLFVTAGVLSHPAGRTTVRLAVPPRERAWWQRLWEKILSPIPNCHAVENRPTFNG
ncbi:MAG TPA: IS1380 family transposase [Candidatus Acidoferrales bacterium]|nr:IS1380 family transposase [Candidatus Acidoferrales bacterium]